MSDQREFEAMLERTNLTVQNVLNVPGTSRDANFRLNNMSFAGPVIMGIGGKHQSRRLHSFFSVYSLFTGFSFDIYFHILELGQILHYFGQNMP